MTSAAHAGDLLRAMRQSRGHTQSDLGRASGVSVRTIRGLERGEIRRPQVATLQQVAIALGIGPQEQAEFLHAWATPAQTGFDRLLVDPTLTEMEQIESLTRSALGSYRVISQNWHTTVGADRRLQRTRCHVALEAVADGLTGVVNVQNGDESTAAGRMEFVAIHGATLVNRWDFPESNVAVFGVGLPHPLAKGERHAYEYEVISHPDLTGGPGNSDGCIWGAPHQTRSIVVSVDFESAPSSVRHVERPPGGDFRFHDEISLDGGRRASIVLEDAPPGAYGFAWEW